MTVHYENLKHLCAYVLKDLCAYFTRLFKTESLNIFIVLFQPLKISPRNQVNLLLFIEISNIFRTLFYRVP